MPFISASFSNNKNHPNTIKNEPGSSVFLELRGGETSDSLLSSTAVVKVMQFHRFLAASFGTVLTFFPQFSGGPLPEGKTISKEVCDQLRAYGILVLGLAYLVHSACSVDGFGPVAQRVVAQMIAGSFAAKSVFYAVGAVRAKPEDSELPNIKAMGFVLSLIFGTVATAYTIALLVD